MTIKAAKELAREQNGRLPRPGYETCVLDAICSMTLTQEWDGRKVFGRFPVKSYLVNEGGRFRVREYCGVTPIMGTDETR